MKVAVIGAGFAGLASAYYLAKKGVDVVLFEKEEKPGGLATGFKEKNWSWPLEKHYHHWFTSDKDIKNLAKDIGYSIVYTRPKTSTFLNAEILQLDSPFSLLNFKYLSIPERIRTGLVLAFLKVTPFWKPLETITAKDFLIKSMGQNSWKVLWEPLFAGKFNKYAGKIPASWFWARVKKRSSSLGYPDGGFESFAEAIVQKTTNLGGQIFYQTIVEKIEKINDKFQLSVYDLKAKNKKRKVFDKVICTLPFPFFLKITSGLSQNYKNRLATLEGLGAVNLVLRLKKQFLLDNTYWLNINEKKFPFLAIVEHTNFIAKKNYGGEHIVYVGNYLPPKHKYFMLEDDKLFNIYKPYLEKINSDYNFKQNLVDLKVFKTPFAQPIIPLNYSKILPPLDTPIEGLFLATIQQVYPWDRGTNYAVEMGKKVARLVNNKI